MATTVCKELKSGKGRISVFGMVDINPRVNLYCFAPHPEWSGVVGSVAVAARDFQRAEGIARKAAAERGVPGCAFSILVEDPGERGPEGLWVEIERYRDVEDVERLVWFTCGVPVDSRISSPESAL